MMLRTPRLLPVTMLAVCCLVASLAPALALRAPQTPGAGSLPLTTPRHHATPSHAAAAPRAARGAMLAALQRRARLGGRVNPRAGVPTGPVEVPRLRTRTSTTAVNRNGVYTVHAYLHSINYQDASGAWQPIDNTIIAAKPEVAAGGYAYQNAGNNYGVAFAASGGATLERVTYGDATLTLSPQDAAASTAAVSGSTISYPSLFPRTDVRYTVEDDAVKEVLLLHDAAAPASFAFALQVAGARPQAGGAVNGGATFVDAAGHSLFALAPLLASDARGATTAVALALQPSGAPGAYALQATIPASWLADPARAWPVALDPTVTFNAVKDVTIDSANLKYKLSTFDCVPNRTSCPEKTVDGVGYFGTWWPGTVAPTYRATVMRTLLQFDLSALPPLVTLLDARLQAAIPTRTGNGYVDQTMDASLYPVITGTAWTTGATWSTYDGSHTWTAPGADYDPSYRVTAALDYSHDTYTHDATAVWNITPLAQQWYLNQNGAPGTRANNGILVRMDDETINSPRKLEWLNGLQAIYNYIPWQGGAAPGGERAFDPHASLKSDRSLVTFPQGDGQQMGVNVSNGDLEIMRNDVSLPSLGIPNVIQRTYHSMAAANGATSIGYGWQLSVGGDSSLTQGPVGDAIYLDPTGQGYDIPSMGSLTTTNVLTNTTTQGNWVGHFGHDGYILNAWNNPGDLTSLPSYAGTYSHPTGTATFWQAGTIDVSTLTNPGQTQRNAAALSGSPQTVQVVTFNARELVTASVYLLN